MYTIASNNDQVKLFFKIDTFLSYSVEIFQVLGVYNF